MKTENLKEINFGWVAARLECSSMESLAVFGETMIMWGKFIIDQKKTVNKSSVNTKMKANTRAAE